MSACTLMAESRSRSMYINESRLDTKCQGTGHYDEEMVASALLPVLLIRSIRIVRIRHFKDSHFNERLNVSLSVN